MNRSSNGRLWVLMPPEFDYLEGLFLPSLSRARLTAGLVSAVHHWRAEGYPVSLDTGAQGLTAPALAAKLRSAATKKAIIAGAGADTTAAGILWESLRREGVECPAPLITTSDASETLRGLSQHVESLDRSPEAFSEHAKPFGQSASPFLITEKGKVHYGMYVPFEERGSRLVRVKEGLVHNIPRWCGEILVVSTSTESADAGFQSLSGDRSDSGAREEETIYALSLPPADSTNGRFQDEWVHFCDSIVRYSGARRFRLAGRDSLLSTRKAREGASWTARYGLDHQSGLRLLTRLVKRHFPERCCYFHTLLGFAELGVDPLEEMYAGNSLADRNSELLENILP